MDSYLIRIMIIQGVYQITVILYLLFMIPYFFDIKSSDQFGINDVDNDFDPVHAVHYTMIFHCTVLIQLANLFNARRVRPYQYNQFQGLL